MLDKGALDAIAGDGENDLDGLQSAANLLAEVGTLADQACAGMYFYVPGSMVVVCILAGALLVLVRHK